MATNVLAPVQNWLDHIEFQQADRARLTARLIPASCPFARDIKFMGRLLFSIPPMCKLNPLYLQLLGLRMRAVTYLADELGEDVTGLL